MKRSKDEAEVIVRLDYKDQLAHICVCQWPAMAAKMRKRYGASKDPAGKFSERWTVPLRAISFRGPAKKPQKASRISARPFSRRTTRDPEGLLVALRA